MPAVTIQPLPLPLPQALFLLLVVILIVVLVPLWATWAIYRRMTAPLNPANWREEWGRIEAITDYEETDDDYSPPRVTQRVRVSYSYDAAG